MINVHRTSTPAVGITQAVYPVPQARKSALLLALLQRDDVEEALVFTRTKHRANRLAAFLVKNGVNAERIHGNRSQAQRTEALSGFKAGKYRVLVATDIAARGIDIEALGHVMNFDVPQVPEDYIRDIERAISKRLPRILLPDFDYTAKEETALEVPLAERIAAIRARKAEERARAKAKAERRAAHGGAGASSGSGRRPGGRSGSSASKSPAGNSGRPGGRGRRKPI
jgi:ATP-dependent RNA helicase RhlE